MGDRREDRGGPRFDLPAPGMAAALAAIGGAALQLQQPTLWPVEGYAGLALAALLLAAAALWWPWRGVMLAVAAALLAFTATGWRADQRMAEALPPTLEGQDLVVTGLVARLPQTDLTGTRFVFEVDGATRHGAPADIPRRLSLSWMRGFDADALLLGPADELRAGQRWRLTVRLRQPHGAVNPYGFDLELWLFERGIRATGYVRSSAGAVAEKLADDAGAPVERLRQRLRDAIERRVSDGAAAGVLAALAVGDQGAIERGDWDVFRATGVAHLVAISGLHVTMFAWLAAAAVGAMWRLNPRLMLAVPAPQAARWGGLLLATAYAVLAGWGVPAQRTVWMLATVVLLRSLGLRWPASRVLLAAALVVTAVDPWALLQPGFWLSFVAVGMLTAAESMARDGSAGAPATRLQRFAALLRGGLRTQAVATVGLAPLTMLFFQQVSLVGFIANLVAIPLVTLAITPLALAGTLFPPLWGLASVLVQGLRWWLETLAQMPWAVWTAAAAPAWAAAAGLLGGTLMVLPLPWRLRALGVPLLLPLLFPVLERPPPGTFELVAADVGQGTAVLLRTRGHLLVYDAGPRYTVESDAGQRVLLPLLRGRGERRVDLLMLSHRDSDHVGGAASLVERAGVAALSSLLAADHPLRAVPLPHARCDAGQTWEWDGVRFEVLHPRAEDHVAGAKPNTLSCVLRVQGQGRSVLLTGDIERDQESALFHRGRDALKTDVLLLPHHGSRTSSSAAFLDAVAPRLAVVQAGYRSRYGHPAADVMARYAERGIEVVRSDRCGAWTWPAEGAPRCERLVARRYWHHGAAAEPPVARSLQALADCSPGALSCRSMSR
jgi:competence protein ComEC